MQVSKVYFKCQIKETINEINGRLNIREENMSNFS